MHSPWKKSYDQPRQHTKKQRHSFADRSPYSQSYGFSSLTCMDVRAGPQRRLSAEALSTFKLWCWRSLLRVPWTVRRSSKSILKKINPEFSLEGLMLKLPYFGYLMSRADSLEKTLMLGKIEGRRRRG